MEKSKTGIVSKKKKNSKKQNQAGGDLVFSIGSFSAHNNLIPEKSKLIVGLSGGPDSVFLLHFLSDLHKNGTISELIAAHLDHEWRADSHKDVEFCHELAKKYGIRLVSAKLSDLPVTQKFNGSLEEIGRNARRFFFEQVLKEKNADLIALAHHAQDQQETFFIRLLRGATLSGLTGMKPKQNLYIRPLLQTNKSEILKFLKSHKIPYLTDPSNESDQFLRNRIRNNVIPALKACDDRFDKKFAQTLNSLKKTENFLELETKKTFELVLIKKEKPHLIDLKKLFQMHPVIYERVIFYWLCQENVTFPVSRGFFMEIIKFLQQPQGGKHQLHHEWQLVKQKGLAHITRKI